MDTPLVCTPAEFNAATPMERRKLVLAQIDLTPELHDQGDWVRKTECGTSFCTAGWAVELAGYQRDGECWHRTAAQRCVNYETLGATLLGLTSEQTDECFYGADTRDEVADVLLELS